MNLLLPLQEPFRLIQAFFIIAGLWVIGKYFWMTINQIKYGGNAGEDYIHLNKKEFHEKYRPNKKVYK
jgi:hypothetical protein